MRKHILTAASFFAVLSASGAQASGEVFTASNPKWKSECASCHVAYPARLLPAESWRALMGGLDKHFGTFYSSEKIPTDPPKGVYTCVAQCGISGTILGPPNYHDYQNQLRKLHAERFARMPFEMYKSRVKIYATDIDEEAGQRTVAGIGDAGVAIRLEALLDPVLRAAQRDLVDQLAGDRRGGGGAHHGAGASSLRGTLDRLP